MKRGYIALLIAITLMNAEYYTRGGNDEDPTAAILLKAGAIEIRFDMVNDSGEIVEKPMRRKTYFLNNPDTMFAIVKLLTPVTAHIKMIDTASHGASIPVCQIVAYTDYLGTKISSPTMVLSPMDVKLLRRLFDQCEAESGRQ